MQIEQKAWSSEKGWRTVKGDSLEHSSLVLLFGSQPVLSRKDILENLNEWYQDAIFLGCTTAGEICNKDIYQNHLVSTAMQFETTRGIHESMLHNQKMCITTISERNDA